MAWKVIGLIESRSGATTILPEWAIGTPNSFVNYADAQTIRDAMTAAVAKEKMALRYVIIPAIDEPLVSQLHQQTPMPQHQPAVPSLSFGPRREAPPA